MFPGDPLVVIATYLWRVLARNRAATRSLTWPLIKATVHGGARCSFDVCRTVEVIYSYSVQGEWYSGKHTEPFMFKHSAEQYAAAFPAGREILVRVSLADPELTVLRGGERYSPGSH